MIAKNLVHPEANLTLYKTIQLEIFTLLGKDHILFSDSSICSKIGIDLRLKSYKFSLLLDLKTFTSFIYKDIIKKF